MANCDWCGCNRKQKTSFLCGPDKHSQFRQRTISSPLGAALRTQPPKAKFRPDKALPAAAFSQQLVGPDSVAAFQLWNQGMSIVQRCIATSTIAFIQQRLKLKYNIPICRTQRYRDVRKSIPDWHSNEFNIGQRCGATDADDVRCATVMKHKDFRNCNHK